MPAVTLHLFGALRDLAGYASVQVDLSQAATLDSLLTTAEAQHGGDLRRHVVDDDSPDINEGITVFVNSDNLRSHNGRHASLKDGDDVVIIMAAPGG